MATLSELKDALKRCSSVHINLCSGCPYYGSGGDPDDPDDEACFENLMSDVLQYLESIKDGDGDG